MIQNIPLLFLVVEYLLKTISMFKSAENFYKRTFSFKIPASLASNVSLDLGLFVTSYSVPLMSHYVLPRELLVVIFIGGWKSKMLSDSGDSLGYDSFESLVNFSLIWYTVWHCTGMTRDNLAMQWSGHIWVNTHVFRRWKNVFLEISSTFKYSSCLKWVINYKKQKKKVSCHMHFNWKLFIFIILFVCSGINWTYCVIYYFIVSELFYHWVQINPLSLRWLVSSYIMLIQSIFWHLSGDITTYCYTLCIKSN